MRSEGPVVSERLCQRMCLGCGYAGRALQGDRWESTFVCPKCGADLYARPPRTYAELEGFEVAAPRASFERISALLTETGGMQFEDRSPRWPVRAVVRVAVAWASLRGRLRRKRSRARV